MPEQEIANLWKVTNGIRTDVQDIKVAVARIEERSMIRDNQVTLQADRMDRLESRLQNLDLKVAGAMGGVAIISYGLQLLVAG